MKPGRIGWYLAGALVCCLPVTAFAGSADLLGAVFGNDAISLASFGKLKPQQNYGLTGIGRMVAHLNQGVLLIAGLVFVWVHVSALLQTAHDGEFLGRTYHSIWVPVRMATGLFLLTPLQNGYCLAQMMMLSLAVAGCGVANGAWDLVRAASKTEAKTVIGKLYSPGRYVVKNKGQLGAAATTAGVGFTRAMAAASEHNDVYEAKKQELVAREAYESSRAEAVRSSVLTAGAADNTPQTRDLRGTNESERQQFLQILNAADRYYKVEFDVVEDPPAWLVDKPDRFLALLGYRHPRTGEVDGRFGEIEFPFASADRKYQAIQKKAILELMGELVAIAQKAKNGEYEGRGVLWEAEVAKAMQARYQGTLDLINGCLEWEAAVDMEDELDFSDPDSLRPPPGCDPEKRLAKANGGTRPTIKKFDWIGVGFMNFLAVRANATHASKTATAVKDRPRQLAPSDPEAARPAGEDDSGVAGWVRRRWGDLVDQAKGLAELKARANEIERYLGGRPEEKMQEGIASDIRKFIAALSAPSGGGKNPIALLQSFGNTLLEISIAVMAVMATTKAWVEAGLGAVQGFAPAFGGIGSIVTGLLGVVVGFAKGAFEVFGGPLTAFVVSGYALGSLLAVYVPLIPFILWIEALIGYLILVVERVLAGSLWALAHLSPYGEGMGQRAEPGYQMVLDLLLRPVLLVLGFLFASAIMEAVGGLAAPAFFGLVKSIDFSSTTLFSGAAKLIAYTLVFVGLMITIIYASFQAIQSVPNRVMQIIGVIGSTAGGNEGRAREMLNHNPRRGPGGGGGSGGSRGSGAATSANGTDTPAGGSSGRTGSTPGNEGVASGQAGGRQMSTKLSALAATPAATPQNTLAQPAAPQGDGGAPQDKA